MGEDTSGVGVGATARLPPARRAQGQGGPRARGCASQDRNPKGPQKHTFLPPIGSPSNRFAHPQRCSMQNFGADLARVGPSPLNLNFVHYFGADFVNKLCFLTLFQFSTAGRPGKGRKSDLGSAGVPWGCPGSPGAQRPRGPRGPRAPMALRGSPEA